jgi:hypothetical protein
MPENPYWETMRPYRPPSVACCVRDSEALKRVRLALEAEGAVVEPVRREDVINQTAAVVGSAALVYDLEPRNGAASTVIVAFRECVKNGPVLLYPQASQHIARHLEMHLAQPAVCLRLRHDNSHDMQSLRADVRRMLNMIPGNRLALLVRSALPQLPELLATFVDEILHSLSGEQNDGRLLVEVMALRAGTRKRTLERLCRESGLPRPKELLDWLILLHVAFVVECERLTWRAATRRMGIRKKTLYRMRHRLLPERGPSNYGLDAVLLAFTQRCGGVRENSEKDDLKAAG